MKRLAEIRLGAYVYLYPTVVFIPHFSELQQNYIALHSNEYINGACFVAIKIDSVIKNL